MTPTERILAVLAGRMPDRPPVSFWYHFPQEALSGPAAVQAHLNLLERFHLDFLKVMNDNPYPHPGPIGSVADLASLQGLHGDEEGFGRQLAVIADLHARLGNRVLMVTTLFNAFATLRLLIQPPRKHLPPNLDPAADHPSAWIRAAYASHPAEVERALQTIGENLARFAVRCIEAGADGIFLSVRDDWVDPPGATHDGLYARLVRPTDLRILEAAKGAPFNILHVCGRPRDLAAYADYPVAALNWADRAAGPPIEQAKRSIQVAMMGGVDNLRTLPEGTPQDVAREVADAIRQAAPRPIIITPGCTFDPGRVPEANLLAMVRAVGA